MAHRPRLHIPILNGSVRLKADIDRLISPRPLCANSGHGAASFDQLIRL